MIRDNEAIFHKKTASIIAGIKQIQKSIEEDLHAHFKEELMAEGHHPFVFLSHEQEVCSASLVQAINQDLCKMSLNDSHHIKIFITRYKQLLDQTEDEKEIYSLLKRHEKIIESLSLDLFNLFTQQERMIRAQISWLYGLLAAEREAELDAEYKKTVTSSSDFKIVRKLYNYFHIIINYQNNIKICLKNVLSSETEITEEITNIKNQLQSNFSDLDAKKKSNIFNLGDLQSLQIWLCFDRLRTQSNDIASLNPQGQAIYFMVRALVLHVGEQLKIKEKELFRRRLILNRDDKSQYIANSKLKENKDEWYKKGYQDAGSTLLVDRRIEKIMNELQGVEDLTNEENLVKFIIKQFKEYLRDDLKIEYHRQCNIADSFNYEKLLLLDWEKQIKETEASMAKDLRLIVKIVKGENAITSYIDKVDNGKEKFHLYVSLMETYKASKEIVMSIENQPEIAPNKPQTVNLQSENSNPAAEIVIPNVQLPEPPLLKMSANESRQQRASESKKNSVFKTIAKWFVTAFVMMFCWYCNADGDDNCSFERKSKRANHQAAATKENASAKDIFDTKNIFDAIGINEASAKISAPTTVNLQLPMPPENIGQIVQDNELNVNALAVEPNKEGMRKSCSL